MAHCAQELQAHAIILFAKCNRKLYHGNDCMLNQTVEIAKLLECAIRCFAVVRCFYHMTFLTISDECIQ